VHAVDVANAGRVQMAPGTRRTSTILLQRMSRFVANLGRAGRSRLCPLSEVLLPRRLLVSEAAYDRCC
jgi:hypothetical protein